MDKQDINIKETPSYILKRISDAKNAEADNNKCYEKNLRFFYECGMDESDKSELSRSEKTQLSFNMLPPIVNQNAKQISDSVPTTKVFPVDQENQLLVSSADYINEKLLELFEKNKYNTQITKASVQAMVASKAIFKMKTDYKNSKSFEQKPIIEYLPDPTKIFFDPKSKNTSRSDAKYVVQEIEFTEEELLNEFPEADLRDSVVNIPRLKSRTGGKDNYCYKIHDYYYYNIEKENIYLLQEGNEEIILSDSELKGSGEKIKTQKDVAILIDKSGQEIEYNLVEKREIQKKQVRQKRILGKQTLEDNALNFDVIPFFQLTAKQWQVDNKMKIAPFIDDAIDAQRAKNLMGNEFLSESLNLYKQMYAISEEQLTDTTLEILQDPNTKNILLYKGVIEGPEGQQVLSSAPTVTPMTNVPPEYIQMFTAMDNTIQSILGAYQLSLDQKELSGQALYNMSQYISGVLTPFTNNLLEMLEAMTLCALSCFRYIYSDEKYDFNYETDEFEIGIEAGVNNKLQQEANLEKLVNLAKINPESQFSQFLASPQGTLLLIQNMDLNNKSKVVQEFNDFVEKSQQQPQQPDPKLIDAQTKMATAQLDAQIKPQELALKNKEIESRASVEINKILIALSKMKSDERDQAISHLLQLAKTKAENLKTLRGQ